jgi:selenoprotein W-related protein
LEAEIREAFSEASVRLIESSGGVFEVTVDGDLVFSKKAIGRHSQPGEVLQLMRERRGE